jgi:hypothetical protein
MEETMLTNFRTYQLAVQFYRQIKRLKLPAHLSNQLLLAAHSIALNLAEERHSLSCFAPEPSGSVSTQLRFSEYPLFDIRCLISVV